MVTIRAVNYAELRKAPNAEEILAEYEAECAAPEMGKICPDEQLYETAEKAGAIQIFAVFDAEQLIGLATVLIYTLPHFSTKMAATESIFVSKTCRRKGIGSRLLAVIKNYATEQGCPGVLLSAPPGSRFSQLLSLRKRCRLTSYVYLWSFE